MRFYSVKEVAEMMRVSPNTVYQWCYEGKMPHFRFEGSIRIEAQSLERWLMAKEVV